MEINFKCPFRGDRKLLICLLITGILIFPLLFFEPKSQKAVTELTGFSFEENSLALIEKNSLLSISNPSNPGSQVIRRMMVVVTAYSSTPWETDDDPQITAAGTLVREGVIANNFFPFGTKIKIPELFGDKIFVVEDRMGWKKDNYQIDVWFPSYWQALNFGVKRTYIEILEG